MFIYMGYKRKKKGSGIGDWGLREVEIKSYEIGEFKLSIDKEVISLG